MNTSAKKNNNIAAENVADYLSSNVGFFKEYPDLLLLMETAGNSDGSISLVERQMKGLRNRISQSDKELRQVIRNAQDNQNLLEETINLSLNLIPCSDIDHLAETLFELLSSAFNIKFKNLLLDENLFNSELSYCVNMSDVRTQLGDNFPKQQPVCGRLKSSEKEAVFGEGSTVNSAAILPLGSDGELGLLVLGSEDATHFDPEMGDLFLTLIAEILSQLLNKLND